MNPVVETVGLTHRYGKHTALQDVEGAVRSSPLDIQVY